MHYKCVRKCCQRYGKEEIDYYKIAGYLTLYKFLEGLIKLVAPFTPFIAEEIYQNPVSSVDPDVLDVDGQQIEIQEDELDIRVAGKCG